MAYNKAYNPDALPAHAEPDQAAQMLAGRRPSPAGQGSAYANLPSQQYRQHSPAQGPQGGRRPSGPSPSHQQSSQQQVHQNQSHQGYRPPPPQKNDNYDQYQFNSRLGSPPPPAGYGSGPRPQARPPPQNNSYSSAPARTPAPPDADSPELWSIFDAANASRTGHMTLTELGSALVNGDYTPFDGSTNRALMRMFTSSPPNQPGGSTLTFAEFQNLWRFLAAWKELFERFDEDRSGRITLNEFSKALVAFGYRLSQPFVGLLYQTYEGKGMRMAEERRGSRGAAQAQGMSFDLFVQACVHLKRMTDVFKNYDDDRDGYITVSFEEFLTEILKLRE